MWKKGHEPWNKGLIGAYSDEYRSKISEGLKKRKGVKRNLSEQQRYELSIRAIKTFSGRNLTEEHKRNISLGMKNYAITDEHRRNLSKANSGENSSKWKGGIESENKKIRKGVEFKIWRERVFERDNWTCQECGVRCVELHPHHIKSFAEHVDIRFDVDNGITLCSACHRGKHKNMHIKKKS